MALDTTKDAIDYLILVRLYTSYPVTFLAIGTEAYYDGFDAYEPRLVPSSLGSLREEFPRGFETRLPLPEMTIEIQNGDGAYTSAMKGSNYFSSSIVEAYCVARGDAVTSADMIFKGRVDFPGGVEYGADTIKIHVSDFRKWWKSEIPKDTFDEDDVAYAGYTMPPETIGKPIPMLYGNWYDTDDLAMEPWEGNYLGVECIVIDTGQDDDGNQVRDTILMVAKPVISLFAIDDNANGVLVINEMKDDAAIVQGLTATLIDLAAGTFHIHINDYTWSDRDRFFVRAVGEVNAAGTIITNPAEIIRHLIMRSITGTVVGSFDTLSYTLTFNYFNDGAMKDNAACRRHITDAVDLWAELSGFCLESGVDLYNIAGKIAISIQDPFSSSFPDSPDLAESDVLPYKDGGFVARVDPDEVYTNKITAKYFYYTPGRQGMNRFPKSESISQTGIIVEDSKRTIEFKWLYKTLIIKWRIARLSFMLSGIVPVYEMMVANRALKWNLTRLISVSLAAHGLTLREMKIRALDKNLNTGVTKITAWDTYIRTDVGRWTDPGLPTYHNADENERQGNGFWTDSAGLCDPTDPYSAKSRWT